MKYILYRISAIIIALIFINFISDYIQQNTVVNDGDFNFEGVVWFFRLTLILAIMSLVFFCTDAVIFHKKKQIKKRNYSLGLIAVIVLLLIIFGGYFMQFVF